MKKRLLVFLVLFGVVAASYAQQLVTGVVTSSEDKMPVIGASILVKGTTQGTITDVDGKYSIKVPGNATLVFSYVGMKDHSVKVNSSKINVVMEPTSIQMDEVVVTAMGVKSEKKKLNFAVQSLNKDEVTAGQSANFVNSLQGKIAGVQVASNGGSPNAVSTVQIRAISSISSTQSNEPLFIIDGMAVRGGGTSAGDINPNDIENMTVLKGAAASALYGQEAANGVIMITTKSGKSGKMSVTGSASIQIDNAVRVPEMQQKYVPGALGFYKYNTTASAYGPLLYPGEKVYDNVGEFLGTGIYQKYDVSASGGTDKFTTYASINYMNSDGVVENDYKKRFGGLLKATYNLNKWIKVNMSMNYMDTKSRGFGNSMNSVYNWPITNNMADYKTAADLPNYGRYDDIEALNDPEKLKLAVSPYWSRLEDKSETQSTRMILNGNIDWEPIKDLIFTGKIAYDKGYSTLDSYAKPRFANINEFESSVVENYKYKFGSYKFQPSRSELLTLQAIGTYSKELFGGLDLNVLFGAEMKTNKGHEASLAGQNFLLGGEFFSFNNTDPSSWLKSGDYPMYLNHYESNKFGYFGELRLDYKGLAQLSATGRYDGSSTLKQSGNATYFYPSVTAGLIFSELFHLSNDWFSFGKLRGNWAKVGKDASRYKFTKAYREGSSLPDIGYSVDPTVGYAIHLEPEMTKSWEVGVDLRLFDSRTRLDVAYYSTTVNNQIMSGVRVSPASGTILQTRNEGNIENYGVEVTFNQEILRSRDFSWTADLNFSLNRGVVRHLPNNVSEMQGPQFADIYSSSYLNQSTTGITGKDYMRSPDGQVICDANGIPQVDPAKGLYIGNREPDFLLGLNSTFRWKDLSVSFLFDGRVGGDVVNVTGRGLFSSGMHKSLEKYLNREVIVNGVVKQEDGSYAPNTTPIVLNQTNLNTHFYGVSSNFIEDASYLRLSYVTVAYDFTKLLKKDNPYIKGLKASVTGRNLFLLTKYSGSDPQVTADVANGSGTMGFDDYSIPSTRSFNFTLNVTF